MCHVLTGFAIAACRGLHQHTVYVAQAHGQTVKFGLGHITDRLVGLGQTQLAADAGVEVFGAAGAGVGFGADAEHGHCVAHRVELVQRFATDPLGG